VTTVTGVTVHGRNIHL